MPDTPFNRGLKEITTIEGSHPYDGDWKATPNDIEKEKIPEYYRGLLFTEDQLEYAPTWVKYLGKMKEVYYE